MTAAHSRMAAPPTVPPVAPPAVVSPATVTLHGQLPSDSDDLVSKATTA